MWKNRLASYLSLHGSRSCSRSRGANLFALVRTFSDHSKDGRTELFSVNSISRILCAVKDGKIAINDAEQMILEQQQAQTLLVGKEQTTFANLDHTRASRTGFPEAVFASGKTPQQVACILDDMAANVNSIISRESIDHVSEAQKAILATRVDAKMYEEIAKIPIKNGSLTYHEVARIISMEASLLSNQENRKQRQKDGNIIIACAGTTDMPVAEESAITLEAAGCNVERIYDVGVAGLHRILNALPRLRHPDIDCVIVCAGMDGALPSVVGGLVNVPVLGEEGRKVIL